MNQEINKNKEKQNFTNMKNALIDQIILWIVLFIVFVSFLFFIIEYSSAIKVKDNMDAIADYVARTVSLNEDKADIATGVNSNIKDNYFSDIAESDIVCTDTTSTNNFQVIVNVKTTMNNKFLVSSDLLSKTVVFNETNSFQTECTLTLTFK